MQKIEKWKLDQLTDLLVVLVADVDAVDLDDAVALPHAGRLRRAARVHLADELAGPRLLRVQVEAVPVERGGLWMEEKKIHADLLVLCARDPIQVNG